MGPIPGPLVPVARTSALITPPPGGAVAVTASFTVAAGVTAPFTAAAAVPALFIAAAAVPAPFIETALHAARLLAGAPGWS